MSKIKYGFWRDDTPQEQGYSKEFISIDYKLLKDTNMDELKAMPEPGVDTLYKAMMKRYNNPDKAAMPFLGTRKGMEYEWMTLKETIDTAQRFAAGAMAMGLLPDHEHDGRIYRFIGIQSKNRKEWNLIHLANMFCKATTVGLYDTLGEEAEKYIINQTEMATIACTSDIINSILKWVLDEKEKETEEAPSPLRWVKNIICMDNLPENSTLQKADEVGIKVYPFDEVLEQGAKNTAFEKSEPGPDDFCMFSYTSGTTGNPKGVQLSQSNLLYAAVCVKLRGKEYGFTEDDSYLSYLPLAHSFEQVLFASALTFGTRIGFFGGDLLKLTKEDLPALKPTIFISVPRLYNRIYGVIKSNMEGLTGCKAWLVRKGVSSKLAALRSNNTVTSGCWDKLVFKKMKAIMGGNVKIMITGSAPISGEVLEFLKICFCCPISQGFGMTETSAGSFIQFPNDQSSGNCGGPVANVKFRLRSIPEMGYDATAKPPKGELLVTGSSIMKGYFKNDEKTAEMLPDGKWLYTGDVAEIMENGAIKIIDRAKNIFKLSQGEYIAPEKLENVYVQSKWIDQVWVHGDSLHDFVILFAVLNPQLVHDNWGEKPDLKDA